MAIFTATATTVGLTKLAKYPGGVIPLDLITSFKVGEGGWIDPGTGRVPRTPDPDLTDLDIIMDLARLPADKRYNVGEELGYFSKALVPGDFSSPGVGVLRVSCKLLLAEYNLKTDGTLVYVTGAPPASPVIWEIGLFDAGGDMILYGTMTSETKTGLIQIENVCRLVLAVA